MLWFVHSFSIDLQYKSRKAQEVRNSSNSNVSIQRMIVEVLRISDFKSSNQIW
jgi:hypothetical protein